MLVEALWRRDEIEESPHPLAEILADCAGPPSFDDPFRWDQADAKPPRRAAESPWTTAPDLNRAEAPASQTGGDHVSGSVDSPQSVERFPDTRLFR